VTSNGLGVINVWVPTQGPKLGPARDSDDVIRVNHDEDDQKGYYESFLISVCPAELLDDSLRRKENRRVA